MTIEEANRRNRAQAAFRAYAARMGQATDHWLLLSEAEVAAWCAASDAALTFGYQPVGAGFSANTCCAGTVMTGQVVIGSSEDWKGMAVAGIVGGAGAAAGAGVPFMVGGGGAAGPMASGSGMFSQGAGPR